MNETIIHFKKMILITLLVLDLALCFGCNSCGYDENPRENIVKLLQGKLQFSEDLPSYEDDLPDMTPEYDSVYDFIIIGAGSAGATIASRLSEVEEAKILLIEAGIKEYPIMDIPSVGGSLQFSDQVNWKYRPERCDNYCRGMKDGRCNWPRGKVVGGSSVLNYMLATRNHKRDYDEWAKMTSDQSWNHDNMLKYLKKLENFVGDGAKVDKRFRNDDGPLYISYVDQSNFTKAFIEANVELGLPRVDYNAENLMGVSFNQLTIINGERWSVNRGYLHPARNRRNLFLTTESHVNKILIDGNTKRAVGIHFTKGNRNIVVRTKKEIILCAGAINSPQILMLSGIGPAKHLRDLGIKLVKNAAVGENLMDHLIYLGLIFKTNIAKNSHDEDILDPENPAILEYIHERTGPLSIGPQYSVLSYINASGGSFLTDYPEVELIFGDKDGIKNPISSEIMGLDDIYKYKMTSDVFNHSSWNVGVMLLHPKSRGWIRLQSKNPKDKPKLHANYLDHPNDLKTMINGIRAAINLSKTKALQKYNSELYDIPLPCNDHEFDTDKYWECAIRTFASSSYHQSGTCKMGKATDKTAVVNSKLKVIGVNGLRVIDASVLPTIVTAHPHITIVAMGEKMSEEIKRDWGYL